MTSISYNLTAVEQTDPTLGTGPAYLLNGLTNKGYWYQVGVSWNWSPGGTPGTGFDMNYEAWDASGNSVFPATGGGLVAFSGTANIQDPVLLSLSFTGSGTVLMWAKDMITNAQAEVTYNAEGATLFVGLPNAVANANGYFTGLMTEWYHGEPYYANPQETDYTDPYLTLSSGWLWMDEFDAADSQLVFSGNTSAVPFNPPNTLQEFSLGETTEYADAYELITGAANVASTSTSTTSITSTSATSTTSTTPTVSFADSITFATSSATYGTVGAYTGITISVTNSWSTAQTIVVYATFKSGTTPPVTYVAQGTETLAPGQTASVFCIDLIPIPAGTYSVTFSAVTTSNLAVSAPTTAILVVT